MLRPAWVGVYGDRSGGSEQDLHSGSFGGTVHNPIQALAEIIAQLHDKNGRVTIPGFYKDVLPSRRRSALHIRSFPGTIRNYAKELGVAELYGEKGFTTLERVWARPTVECNGIIGGFTGDGAKTVLPSKASAKISMRLCSQSEIRRHGAAVPEAHQEDRPEDGESDGTRPPWRRTRDHPDREPRRANRCVGTGEGFGKKPLYQREGGSIPIVVQFKQILGIDSVLLGFGLPDENAHAPDEFLDLENFLAASEHPSFLQ